MSRRKAFLVVGLYLGLAAGLPALLLLLISQNYSILNASSSSNWQVRTYQLVIEPQGRFFLPLPSAFVVHKGQATLIIYPLPDQFVSQLVYIGEGKTFATATLRRHALINEGKTPVEVVLVEMVTPQPLIPPPTITASANLNQGFNLKLLEQSDVPAVLSQVELEQIAADARQKLLAKTP